MKKKKQQKPQNVKSGNAAYVTLITWNVTDLNSGFQSRGFHLQEMYLANKDKYRLRVKVKRQSYKLLANNQKQL